MSLIDPTQQALEGAIQGAALRQQALAGNLANVNTPGYQRRDVDFHAALRTAVERGRPPAFATATETGVVRADGGGVDVDRESAELAKNALEQQALVSVARVRIEVLVHAMGAGAA
ncbi:flagellar basal body rod protein FlgB [Patulibacter defluvii]|uniref:flagellar basal body rod protein FlgB n=1 Tax=Patulibacter defluvii TaxID=3095358 RepID=UPI002A74C85C|nr:flagellar basal body protein [Patulibacter sp. DM4]